MKRFSVSVLLALFSLMAASPVFAQEGGAASPAQWSIITAGFAMAFASAICALGQAKAIAAACEGLARNPGAAPAIRFALLLGLVLIESLALYTLLIIFIKV
ncbi:MAG: ATP synthase F0 subunit C [Acidobacteriota bacterium]